MTEPTCVALTLIIACAFLAAVLFDARDEDGQHFDD